MTAAPSIVWFRQDLRLADNPALCRAIAEQAAILPLFILDDESLGERRPGAAQRWWLHHSLASLDQDLRALGSRLILRSGPAERVLQQLVADSGARRLYWNRCYDPESVTRDRAIKSWAKESGLEVETFNALLLMEPWEVKTKEAKSYRVFSPFWRRLREAYSHQSQLQAPRSLSTPEAIASDVLDSWELTPQKPDWAKGFGAVWQPGESGARQRLSDFLDETLSTYKSSRDRPDREATSCLSPHLRFGEVSPRQIWEATQNHLAIKGSDQGAADKFLSEVAWREFSYHLLFNETDLASQPLRPAFAAFPWRQDATGLERWQKGLTGYPIVDAGMRQLWQTGWMHNRVRMLVASFLVKDLLVPWQEGEAWFWDTLVDGDPANNTASWQWVAGCGADAAPYFRIFNPVSQGERFDPEGRYVRNWVPELAELPDRYIHKPWEADPASLAAAGVSLGKSYPERVVDHSVARRQALEAYQQIKKETAA
ncbi:MAG: deoxyribodipyrimidine photo-lyase [Kiloniellales bacterium]